MRKGIATALIAVTVAGSMIAAAAPAAAQSRYGYRRDRDNGSAAIVAGIAGLAIGAAIASSSNNRSYGGGYYAPYTGYGPGYSAYGSGYGAPYSTFGSAYGSGYYAQPYAAYGYGGGQTCTRRDRVYDRYSGRTIVQTQRYPC